MILFSPKANDNTEREWSSKSNIHELYLVSPTTICVTLGKLLSLSVAPFPYLKKHELNNVNLARLIGGFDVIYA